MDQPMIQRTSYPNSELEHVTGLTNAQRYSVIIKSFLSGVGSDVLRAILMQAAHRTDCTIPEFLYLHQTSIIYNLQQKLRDYIVLVYPPDNSDPVIQQWNCRLLCLVLKSSGCLDTRGEDDVKFIERTYHKHIQSEKTKTRHSASGTKQQPNPKREWIRTCSAIQRLVENLDDARLLSSVRNFICKIEMGAKIMDARIQSHLSLTKMISELAASHSNRLSTEDKVLRKQIGELAKIKQLHDTVSKPSFVSSRSSKNLSRSMIVDGKETRPLSARDIPLQDKPFRPKSAGSVISQKTTETSIKKPYTRSGSFDSAKLKDTAKTQTIPFSNTGQPVESAHLFTHKLSRARKQSPSNVQENNVDDVKMDGMTVTGPPVTIGKESLESSYSNKDNETINTNGSSDLKKKNEKTVANKTKETASMSNFTKFSKTSKNKQYANSVIRPHSFDISGTNRPSPRHDTEGNANKKVIRDLSHEKIPLIKERTSDIEKVYSQSLKLPPQTHDKQTNSEMRTAPSLVNSHMQESLIEKQNQARLVVSQPAYSSLVAYTSKYNHISLGKKESSKIKSVNGNATPGKIVDEKIIEDGVNNEHIEGKEDADEDEKVSQSSTVHSELKQEPPIIPVKTRNTFGLLKALLKSAFSSKRSENFQITHNSNNEISSTEVSNQTETVYNKTTSSPTLESSALNDKMHARNENEDPTVIKEPGSNKENIPIVISAEKRENTSCINQNERNRTSADMVQDISINKSKTSHGSTELHINQTQKEQTKSDDSHVEAKQNSRKETSEGDDIKQLRLTPLNILPTTKRGSVVLAKECEIQEKEKLSEELIRSVSNVQTTLSETENKQVGGAKETTRGEQSNGTKLRKTTRVRFGTEQDNSANTLNAYSYFCDDKKRRQSLPALAFLSHDKPATDIAVNNIDKVDRKSPSSKISSSKSSATRRRASVAAGSLHGFTGVKSLKALNETSKTHHNENDLELKKKKNENVIVIEVEKDDEIKEDSKDCTAKTQSTEEDTILGNEKRVENTRRSSGIEPTAVQKQETRKTETRQESPKAIAVSRLTQHKSKQELFKRSKSEAEFNSVALPTARLTNGKQKSKLEHALIHDSTMRPPAEEYKTNNKSLQEKSKPKQELFQRSKSDAEFRSDAQLLTNQTNEKQTKKNEQALVHDSNMRLPAGENNKTNKTSLLENTALYEDEAESDIDHNQHNSTTQSTLGEKRTTATYLDQSSVKDQLEEKQNEKHINSANIDIKQSDQRQDTNNLNHQLPEEDPEAEMKRIANDVIVHHQVHKVAREFMEKDNQFVDKFFTFLHKYKATKEFLKSEQFSPLKTMRLPTGIKAALSFLHAFTYRHVNIFERDQCNYVVEKILKRLHCEDAQRVKEKEEDIILEIKAEMKLKKPSSLQDGKTDKKESAGNMRKKKSNFNNEDISQKSKKFPRGEERLESPENKRPISLLKRLHDIERCKCWKCQQKDLAMTVAVNWKNHGICHLLQSYGVNFKIDHLLPAVRAYDSDNVKEIVAYLKKRFEWDPENGDAKMALILARFHDMQDIVAILEREGVQDERVVQCTCFA